jgi:hypothetical protein
MLLQGAQFFFGTNQQLSWSTTSLPPTKPIHRRVHKAHHCTLSHTAHIQPELRSPSHKIRVNIALLLTRVIANTALHRICDQLIRSQSNMAT